MLPASSVRDNGRLAVAVAIFVTFDSLSSMVSASIVDRGASYGATIRNLRGAGGSDARLVFNDWGVKSSSPLIAIVA